MAYNLLKGKRGIITGALDANSIAWKVAEKAHEEGATFVLTNAPIAMRMGEIKKLAESTGSEIIPADATNTEELNFFGSDRVVFMFNANLPRGQVGDMAKTMQFQPIRKVASGGELSRLMLCIKSLVAKSIDLPTLIFDEIDTGISGEAAKQVGIILKELAAKRQVICITHQPQIAGKADSHFFVYKEIVKDVVKTNIRQLSNEERITAIAKMLGGEKPTAAALENAREMVAN